MITLDGQQLTDEKEQDGNIHMAILINFLDGWRCTLEPQCVVPENINTSPMDVFGLNPLPTPLEIPD